MPKLVMLIGLPGGGKTTAANQLYPNFVRVSSDDFIEDYADRVGKTYGEVFQDVIPHATHTMYEKLDAAIAADQDIVWDQTNLDAKARKGKLKTVPKHYEKIALVIPPTKENLERVERVNQERKSKGRSIPDYIMSNMAKRFEMPTEAEGFDEVIVF